MQNLQKKNLTTKTPTSTASSMQDRNFPPLPHQTEFAVPNLKKKKVIQREHVYMCAYLKSVSRVQFLPK